MTNVVIYKKDGSYKGFYCEGHAGYSKAGNDIVCSAISVLTQNTINSIETLTDAKCSLEMDEEDAIMKFIIEDNIDDRTDLLMASFQIGINSIHDAVEGKYISIKFEEV